MKGNPVNLQSQLPTASFAYNILPTASFAHIPDCQQSDCLQAIIAHIHITHMTLLRTYTLHTWHYYAYTHMIPHGLTTFHAKRDSTQTYVSNFLVESPRREVEHTASTHVFSKNEIPHGFTTSHAE